MSAPLVGRLARSGVVAALVLGALSCKSEARSDARVASTSGVSAPSQVRETTLAKTRAIVGEVLGLNVKDVPIDVPVTRLSKPADDLAVVEIVLGLEEAFHVEIPDDAIALPGDRARGGVADDITVIRLAQIVEKLAR